MNTKTTLTTLVAAAALTAGGFAIAQADPPSSTAGNNCTATGNAMRGGNMSADPSKTACATAPRANTAAAPAATTESATTAGATGAPDSSAMGNAAAKPAKPMRVAKSDRN